MLGEKPILGIIHFAIGGAVHMLRKAVPADIPAIHNIINYYIRETTYNYHTVEQELSATQAWFAVTNTRYYDLFVLEEKGEIIGYSSYGPFRGKAGYRPTVEHSVYLLPGHEGKGYGTLLLDAIITGAREKGYWSMVAVIDSGNVHSIDFHLHKGFFLVGEMPHIAEKWGKPLSVTFLQLHLQDISHEG